MVLSVLITGTVIRYLADFHFREAMKYRHFGQIDEHIEAAKEASRLNPYVLNYTNVLALAYHQTAIKSMKAGLDRKETAKWMAKSMQAALKVQGRYPGEYYSARMLTESYGILDLYSMRDLSQEAERYTKIAVAARPYSERGR